MNDAELDTLLSAISLYSSFFLTLIVFSFVCFIAVLVVLIKNIKSRRNLKENRTFLTETIQTQEEERSRISGELHDSVSQNIKALILMQKEALELAEKTSDKILCAKLQKIIEAEKQNQKELRSIIQNLVLPPLENAPFKNVIKDTCEAFQEQSGIPCKVFIAPDASIEAFNIEEKHHILRIIQEALNNSRVHSGCTETSVIIRKTATTGNLPDAKTGDSGGQQKLAIMILTTEKVLLCLCKRQISACVLPPPPPTLPPTA